MTVTSRQRRANDRRRFWSGYPAFLTRRQAEYGTGHHLADRLIYEVGEPFLRALYRAERKYNRLKARARRRSNKRRTR